VNLTPEQKERGRQRFLEAVSAGSALDEVRKLTALAEPPRSRPVRVGFIGVGGQGRVLLGRSDPAYADVKAMADINPAQLAAADDVLKKAGRPAARHYTEWREMLEKEDLEAVVLGVPLWLHAEVTVGAMEAGRHVLCEKMMAWDGEGCQRMADAAGKTGRVLEIGYQRYYNPTYVAAYHGVIRPAVLGDVYHARLVWHRNQNWRRTGTPPAPGYDPSRWGYPTYEHLLNWRLYWKYSKGLFAELASHQVNVVNWFVGATAERVSAAGGVYRFTDGREVQDHVYATWDYPGGFTADFSSIESNASEGNYEAFFGTKATLIMSGETEAYLFPEGDLEGTDASARGLPRGDPARARLALGWEEPGKPREGRRPATSSQLQVSTFCAAIRGAAPLACGHTKAVTSARACLRANEAAQKKTRLAV
jgi:predicted dehydrogenase